MDLRKWISQIVSALLAIFGNRSNDVASDFPATCLGSYKLNTVVNEQNESVIIPNGNFVFTISTPPTKEENNVYDFTIALGNRMGGSMTVVSSPTNSSTITSHNITFGPIYSTMMMPPEDIYQLEITVSKILQDADMIQCNVGSTNEGTNNDKNLTIIYGPKGKMGGIRINNV